MQQDADFITADFLYMFRASSAHHEYKILTRHAYAYSSIPNMAKWGPTYNHNYLYRWLPCQYFILLMMGAWRPKHVEKVCGNKICILLHHVGVLFILILWCTETQNKKNRERETAFWSLKHFCLHIGVLIPHSMCLNVLHVKGSNQVSVVSVQTSRIFNCISRQVAIRVHFKVII